MRTKGHGCGYRELGQELPVIDETRLGLVPAGHGCGHRGLGQELHVIDDNIYLNSFGKVTDVVIEALAKNCTALTTVYVDSCDKVTDVGIEAVAKNCTSLTTI